MTRCPLFVVGSRVGTARPYGASVELRTTQVGGFLVRPGLSSQRVMLKTCCNLQYTCAMP